MQAISISRTHETPDNGIVKFRTVFHYPEIIKEKIKLKIFNFGICAAAQSKVPLIKNAAYAAECEEINYEYTIYYGLLVVIKQE